MNTFQWLTTAPNPRSHVTGHPDAGQRGWRTHAVRAEDTDTLGAIRYRRAACGLLPSHGWCADLFIEQKCARCERALKNR